MGAAERERIRPRPHRVPIMSQSWRLQAACRGLDPSIFYPSSDNEEDAEPAKAVCDQYGCHFVPALVCNVIEDAAGDGAFELANRLFGLTFEPVVVVYNRKALAGTAVPRNRFDIIDLLRGSPELFAGKVATYDIEASGVGYLFAFEDARQASTYGRLIESLGRSSVVLQCCTGDILDGVAEGRWLLGYNVIGSYAALHARNDPRIGVIYPKDYTLILSRAAYIPKAVGDPAIAADFLDFTLSDTGRSVLAELQAAYEAVVAKNRS